MLTRRRLAMLGLTILTCATLYGAYAFKKPCLTLPWGGDARLEYRNLCYNDIQALYGVRALDHRAFPYVNEKSYEYPVAMGLAMWGASLFANDYNGYFKANLPLLTLAALLTLWGLMGAMGPRPRVLWYAAGTPLLFYAYLNWDLLPAACIALAIWAWARKRDFWAGAALGVGVAAKIYPGFCLPALLVARRKDPKALRALLAGAAASWGLLNIPIMIACLAKDGDIGGWWGVFTFHGRRSPDFGTIWYWIPTTLTASAMPAGAGVLVFFAVAWVGLAASIWAFRQVERGRLARLDATMLAGYAVFLAILTAWVVSSPAIAQGAASDAYRELVDRASGLIFGAGAVGLLARQWLRGRDAWTTSAAILALYLTVSKIHSPQHALWIFPLLVAVSAPAPMLLVYLVGDALAFVGVFAWFATDLHSVPLAVVLAVGVTLRAGCLFALAFWLSWKGEDLLEAPAPAESSGNRVANREGVARAA